LSYLKIIRLPIACAALFALAGAAPANKELPGSRLLEEARRIVASAKESHYSHTTEVDEDKGVFNVDCSGLVCYVLKRVAPEHLRVIDKGGHKRPLALQFYEAFSGETPPAGWATINKLADAKPGDVIAWRKEEQVKGDNTGHVVIVDAAPVVERKGLMRVAIIDSTESPHAKDTRKEGQDGVGSGTIWFVVDQAGKPVGYKWKSEKGPTHEVPISIGRAQAK
jgi:hypothetical protein